MSLYVGSQKVAPIVTVGGGAVDDVEVNGTSVVSGGVASITTAGVLPSQSGNSGKFLTTDGSAASWADVDSLPSQAGNAGKVLTTNGTVASWAEVDSFPSQSGNSGKFLTTDGTDVSWADVDSLPSQAGNVGKVLITNGTDASWADVNDNVTVTKNSSNKLQTVAVIDNRSGNAIKTWTGTRAQYDAIATKDANTLYNIIDDNESSSSSIERIGQIISSTIPLTDAGLHLLDGALISGNGSYSAFVDYIAGLTSDYPDLFDTEANWQSAVTQYGVCGKFVYNSVNNTVRLPKITGIVEGTTSLTALGDLVEAGLPNITARVGNGGTLQDGSVYSGAFYNDGTNSGSFNSGSYAQRSLSFDASRSNSIYGNSTTVQPQAIKVLYYIVVATSTKTDIQVDIDEVAADLNGKADVDLTNVNNQGKILMSRMGMPSSTYTALTVGASGSTYTAPANGWVIVRCGSDRSNYYIYLQNDTNGFEVNPTTGTPTPFGISAYIPVNKGDVFRLSYQNVHFDFFRFYYAVGSESEAS